jgi:hypothetical protein
MIQTILLIIALQVVVINLSGCSTLQDKMDEQQQQLILFGGEHFNCCCCSSILSCSVLQPDKLMTTTCNAIINNIVCIILCPSLLQLNQQVHIHYQYTLKS